MGLFKPDLYRSFALGFALGTAVLVSGMVAQSDKGLAGQMIPAAEAAPAHPDLTLIEASR